MAALESRDDRFSGLSGARRLRVEGLVQPAKNQVLNEFRV